MRFCRGASVRRAVPPDRLDVRVLGGSVADILLLAGVHVDVPLEHAPLVDHQVRLLERDITDDPAGWMNLQLLLDVDRPGHLAAHGQHPDVDVRLDLARLAYDQLLLRDDLAADLPIDAQDIPEADLPVDLRPFRQEPADVVLGHVVLEQGVLAERHDESSLHRFRPPAAGPFSAPFPRSTGTRRVVAARRRCRSRSRSGHPFPSWRCAPSWPGPSSARRRPPPRSDPPPWFEEDPACGP